MSRKARGADLGTVLGMLGGPKAAPRASSGPRPATGNRGGGSALNRALAQQRKQKQAKQKKKDDGGFLHGVEDFGANVVQHALQGADVPASYIRSHLADIGGALEDHNFGKAASAAMDTVTGAPAGGLAGAAQLVGADGVAKDVNHYNSYEAQKLHGRDFLAHTGTGTYLERDIKRHPKDLAWMNKSIGGHIPGTPVDIGVSAKDLVGLTGDVATDPLTYLTGGASDIASQGLKAAALHIAGAGAEDAAKTAIEHAGLAAKAADPVEEFVRQARREAIKKSVDAGAATAVKKITAKGGGLRQLSPEEFKTYLGESGGIKVRLPGTGRVGRAAGLAKKEVKGTLVPKGVTDLLNPAAKTIKGAAQTLGEKTFGKISSKAELNALIRNPATSGEEIIKALKANRDRLTEMAREEAGLRLSPSEAEIAAVDSGKRGDAIHAAIGPQAKQVLHNARKLLRSKGALEAAVAGDTTHAGGAAIRDAFDRLEQTARDNGVDVAHRENYVPQVYSEAAKKAHGIVDRGTKGGVGDAFFEQARKLENLAREQIAKAKGIRPEEVTGTEVRAHINDLQHLPEAERQGIRDALKGKSYLEDNPEKLAHDYADALNKRITKAHLDQRYADEGITQAVPKVGKLDKAALDATEKSYKQAGQQAEKLRKKLVANGMEQAEAQRHADKFVADAMEQAKNLDAPGIQLPLPLDQSGAAAAAPTAEGAAAEATAATAPETITQPDLFSSPVVETPRTPKAKQQAFDRALDLGQQAAEVPAAELPQHLQSVLDDATRKAQIEADAGITDGLQAQRLKVAQEAAQVHDVAAQKALSLQASALDMQDQIDRLYDIRKVERDAAERLKAPIAQKKVHDIFMQGKETLLANPDMAAPRDLAEVLNGWEKLAGTPKATNKFLRYYDTALNGLKAWQLATPGFHVRNWMGGTINNYIAGVELGSQTRFIRALRAYSKGTLEGQEKEWMDQLFPHLSTGQYSAAEVGAGDTRNALQKGVSRTVGSDNPYVRMNRFAGAKVEQVLRGSLAWDRMLKGKTIDEALSDVIRFHFDYQDLSPFERNVVKRVVPFYSWTRHNVPLQVEMFLQSPGKYSRYWQVRQEIAAPADPGKPVPSYFGGMFGIPTGIHSGDGSQAFVTPDLPYTQTLSNAIPNLGAFDPKDPIGSTLTGVLEPYLSQITPLIKTPTELAMGKQVFKGIPLKGEPYKNLSRNGKPGTPAENPSWAELPGVLPALKALGLAKPTTKGLRITDTGQYAVEQFMPELAHIRKTVPKSEKDKARLVATVASLLGAPVRLNTPYDQRTEALRRRFERSDAKAAKRANKGLKG